jgi:hypothetical protein
MGSLENKWVNHAQYTMGLIDRFCKQGSASLLKSIINAFLDSQPMLLKLSNEYARYYEQLKWGGMSMIEFNETVFEAINSFGGDDKALVLCKHDIICGRLSEIYEWLEKSAQF